MSPNFIVIYLCDNDFGYELDRTARFIIEALSADPILVSEERVKEVVVDLMVAFSNLNSVSKGFAPTVSLTKDYLTKSLKVVFADHAPVEDHDGGSVAIDRNRTYIWRF